MKKLIDKIKNERGYENLNEYLGESLGENIYKLISDLEALYAKDRIFIQEIIDDLHKNGFRLRGKADEFLRDWSRELKNNSGIRKTKRTKRESL